MWRREALLFGLLLAASCQRPASARRVVGPDGAPTWVVSCESDEARCYELIGARCPHGYDLAPTASRRPGVYLARCRAPHWTTPSRTWAVAPVATPVNPWAGGNSLPGDTSTVDPWQTPAVDAKPERNAH